MVWSMLSNTLLTLGSTLKLRNSIPDSQLWSLPKALFIWRKVFSGRRVTRLPELPWASQLFLYFLTKLGEPSTEKQKIGSAGRVTRLAGSPFFNGRVTLLAGPTFLHMNTLARPAGSTPSRRDNQSMRERCWLGQRGQLLSHINARWSWLG